MDSPTPAGFVQDAEEALGKARAMRDQARDDYKEWSARVERAYRYLERVRKWERNGGTGKPPKMPT